ncbi:ribosome hibernation-promoting factor, HPF/YfiA family [Virgibacillus halodenitrificans]|uniref:ribosome hibernation-promoting factor, HPF/YfiA family n=1 Tax=Virgibacillus halodenitrificans TaxID=1482 RepID=UPI000EF53EFF|nr:ribosome-associated translation inhibitor RaiA [Virgibacillus halodenitrificans]
MVQMNIRGENIEVTNALHDYSQKKLDKLERYFDEPLTNVNVNLKIYKVGQKAEVTIPIMGTVLRAEETNQDLYAAIDVVVDKLERQIHKYKTRLNRKNRHPPKMSVNNTFIPTNEEDDDEIVIVRKKRFELKPMNAEEAVLQMEMLGHGFFVFFNGDTEQTNIVYKRKNGKYGLIEAK